MNFALILFVLGFLHTAVSDECTAGELDSFATGEQASFGVNCVTAQFGDVVCYDIFDRGAFAADFTVIHRQGTCEDPDLQSAIETCQGQAESKCKVCRPHSAAFQQTCVIVTCANDQVDCTLSYRVSLNEDTACRMEQQMDLSNDGLQEIFITDACAERPKVCVQVTSEEVVSSSFEVNMYANCQVEDQAQRRARDDDGEDDIRCFTDVAQGDCLQIQCDNAIYDCDLAVSIGDENFNAAVSLKASILLPAVLIVGTTFLQ